MVSSNVSSYVLIHNEKFFIKSLPIYFYDAFGQLSFCTIYDSNILSCFLPLWCKIKRKMMLKRQSLFWLTILNQFWWTIISFGHWLCTLTFDLFPFNIEFCLPIYALLHGILICHKGQIHKEKCNYQKTIFNYFEVKFIKFILKLNRRYIWNLK